MKVLMLLMALTLFTLGGCGDDGDSNSVTLSIPEIQREEGPVSTGESVRVNTNVNNQVIIKPKTVVVDNDELVLDCDVEEAGPVVHQQVIYVAPNCSAVQNIENRSEVEVITGPPVATLESQEGGDYTLNQRVPTSQLPATDERFVLIIYSEDNAVNIPIVCMPFQVQIIETPTTTGGTAGGTTTGGTTTGGTTTGGTTTGGTTTGGTTTGGTTTGGTTNGGTTNGAPSF